MKSKTIVVRMPVYLLRHCDKRIVELGQYHDMDMSKFIRWLIRKDYQQAKKDIADG